MSIPPSSNSSPTSSYPSLSDPVNSQHPKTRLISPINHVAASWDQVRVNAIEVAKKEEAKMRAQERVAVGWREGGQSGRAKRVAGSVHTRLPWSEKDGTRPRDGAVCRRLIEGDECLSGARARIELPPSSPLNPTQPTPR